MQKYQLVPLLPAALLLLSLLLYTAASAAPAPGVITLTRAQVFDHGKPASDSPVREFSHKSSQSLDLLLKVKLATNDGKARRIGVFVAVSDAEGNVVRKIKESYDQLPGESEYQFSDVLSLDGVLGQQNYSVDIEISAKGFSGAREKLGLKLTGPPAPKLRLEGLRLFNEAGKETNYFNPEERFSAELRFSVDENKTSLLPSVGIVAGMVGPYSAGYAAGSDDVLLNNESDALELEPGIEGEYVLRFNGRLPKYFDQPEGDQHAFALLCRVSFGDRRLASLSHLGLVLDNRPKGERGRKSSSERMIKLQDSADWSLKIVSED